MAIAVGPSKKGCMIGSPKSRGFTLLELIVAVGIFTLLLLIVAGFFSRFVFVQRRDAGAQIIEEDLRFAIETFNREARLSFGSTYALADGTGQSIVMRNQNNLCVNYRLNTSTRAFERAEVAAGGVGCLNAAFSGYASLTGNRVIVESLRFDVPDSIFNVVDQKLDRQGFVTLIIAARAVNLSTTPLTLQSSVTSRQIKPYAE